MPEYKRRSCDACHKRKIRCDAADVGGTCNWCQHHDLQCVFSNRKKKTTKVNKSNSLANMSRESLVRRIEMLEAKLPEDSPERLTSMVSTSPEGAPASAYVTPISPPRGPPEANWCSTCRFRSGSLNPQQQSKMAPLGLVFHMGRNFGLICPRTGLTHLTAEFEDWIHMKTGEWPRFEVLPEFQPSRNENYLGSHGGTSLPSRWVMKALFDIYTSSELILVFPVIDSVLFLDTIELAYDASALASTDHTIAKACVFAFLAISKCYFASTKESAYVDDMACAREAHRLLLSVREFSLNSLQATCMLFLHGTLSGLENILQTYHSLACRSVIALGGHLIEMPVPKDGRLTRHEREDRQLRILFWFCYYFDKNMALRTGFPPVFDDDFCDLTLPVGYEEVRFGNRTRNPNDDCQTPFLPGDLYLCFLKSKVLKSLYTYRSINKKDAEILRTIRELDEDVEIWRQSVPPEYSPALSVRKDMKFADHLGESATMLHIELHLEYHHLLHSIHTASNRISAGVVGAEENIDSGIQSSLDMSVEASRSTLIYLNAATHRLVGSAFCVFIFYPLSAMMTLFMSILRNPRHENARHDVEILRTASNLVHSMPRHQDAQPFAAAYLKQTDAIIAELVQLAQAAIAKAH